MVTIPFHKIPFVSDLAVNCGNHRIRTCFKKRIFHTSPIGKKGLERPHLSFVKKFVYFFY